MATLTLTLAPEIIEAARLEAERRHTTLDQLVADTLASVATKKPNDDFGHAKLVRLMARAPLGNIGKPLTRDEIYAERTWPRS
jgi:hypothetical protein